MIHNHNNSIQPSQFLVDNLGIIPRGRVLDIAMGAGRNSIFLADNGFEVEGLDVSPDAVVKAMESAIKAGVSIAAKVADLEREYKIEADRYDAIICFYYLQRSLFPQIKDGLRKGGLVIYETFIVDQVQFGKPTNPDYLLEHNELLHIFSDFRCLSYREGIFEDRKAVASIVARKI